MQYTVLNALCRRYNTHTKQLSVLGKADETSNRLRSWRCSCSSLLRKKDRDHHEAQVTSAVLLYPCLQQVGHEMPPSARRYTTVSETGAVEMHQHAASSQSRLNV